MVKWVQKTKTVKGDSIDLPEGARILSSTVFAVAIYADGSSIKGPVDTIGMAIFINKKPVKETSIETTFTYVEPIKE